MIIVAAHHINQFAGLLLDRAFLAGLQQLFAGGILWLVDRKS